MLNQKQQKLVGLEVKIMLQEGSILEVYYSKGEFLSSLFLVTKKFEGNGEGFALSGVYVANGELHVQNRSEGCILQCSSTQRFTKSSTLSLGRELVRIPVSLFWFGTSSQNIQKIIEVSSLSFETCYDKRHDFFYFGQHY